MRKYLGTRRRLVIFGLAVALAAAAATSAWAAGFNGGSPPARFAIQFNGTDVQAASYTIDGTSTTSAKGATTRGYKVVIDAPVLDNTLATAFQNGKIADVKITLYDVAAEQLSTYDFANATVDSYQQTGSEPDGSPSGSFQQELVLTSSSLTVS